MKKVILCVFVFLFWGTNAIAATEVRVLKKDLACESDGILAKYYKFLKQGDKEAADKWAATAIARGRCVVFSAGEQVFFEEVCGGSWLPSRHYTVKIRRKGSISGYCIVDESVSSEWNPDVRR